MCWAKHAAKEVKSVEMVRVLKRSGWIHVRMKGSHQTGQATTGRTMSVSVGYKVFSAGVVQKVMKELTEEAS